MTDRKVRWAILGTGNIATQFACALQTLPDAQMVAVGSRSEAKATQFAKLFGIPRAHVTYAALAADDEIDLVYVATPHALHMDNTILCLEAGKGVVCEKPFTINRRQAETVLEVARRRNAFVMEAMWTRFIPAVVHAIEMVRAGEIGDVRAVQASFGFRADPPGVGALFDPALGGGSLLDVGIYPVAMAHLVFGGKPKRIVSSSTLSKRGIDEHAGLVFEYPCGGMAVLASSITADFPGDAYILGTRGSIRLHDNFWNATRISITRIEGDTETLEFPLDYNGYEYEAREAQACFRAGRLESDLMPHRATLEVLEIMDEARAQWGLKYPME